MRFNFLAYVVQKIQTYIMDIPLLWTACLDSKTKNTSKSNKSHTESDIF